jgi:hypothetical protein
MKLYDPNAPLPEGLPEAESKSKSNPHPGPGTKRVVHRPLFDRQKAAGPEGARAEAAGQGEQPTGRLEGTEGGIDISSNPGQKLRTIEEAAKDAKGAKLPLIYRLRPDRTKARYAYWDVAAALSLIVNVVLLALLLITAGQVKQLKQTISTGLLSGLYRNFVDMDRASISTTINVNAQVPLNFVLPVSQNTTVVLTQNVTIPNAYVTINTQTLNISAPAKVTLPSGTNLPIALNLGIPVQVSVPISLQVPVNIPLAQTSLHGPINGLQSAIRPYYCMLEPNAQYPQGTYICQQTSPSTGTPGVP